MAPARNFRPFISKSSSVACIATSAFLKRNVSEQQCCPRCAPRPELGRCPRCRLPSWTGDDRHRLIEHGLVGNRRDRQIAMYETSNQSSAVAGSAG